MKFTAMSARLPEPQNVKLEDLGIVTLHITQMERELRQHFNGGIGFGDGTNSDNMFGVFYNYTTNAIADTQDTINHNLGIVPIGFLTLSLDKGAVLYKGATAWTSTQIFLKATLASVAARIFILAPSNTQH
jgi:hypothetical protein